MKESTLSTPPKLWQDVWNLLQTAVHDGNTAFATPIVTTVASPQVSRPRTVVLRDLDRTTGTLTCYTDRRSLKMDHLSGGGELSWCAWDADSSLQFVGGGPTHEADTATRRTVWADLPKHGRKAYATLSAPGSPLPNAGTGLPQDWEDRDLAATDYAFAHFTILVTRLRWAEVLHLDREGNTRLGATRQADDWSFSYLVP